MDAAARDIERHGGGGEFVAAARDLLDRCVSRDVVARSRVSRLAAAVATHESVVAKAEAERSSAAKRADTLYGEIEAREAELVRTRRAATEPLACSNLLAAEALTEALRSSASAASAQISSYASEADLIDRLATHRAEALLVRCRETIARRKAKEALTDVHPGVAIGASGEAPAGGVAEPRTPTSETIRDRDIEPYMNRVDMDAAREALERESARAERATEAAKTAAEMMRRRMNDQNREYLTRKRCEAERRAEERDREREAEREAERKAERARLVEAEKAQAMEAERARTAEAEVARLTELQRAEHATETAREAAAACEAEAAVAAVAERERESREPADADKVAEKERQNREASANAAKRRKKKIDRDTESAAVKRQPLLERDVTERRAPRLPAVSKREAPAPAFPPPAKKAARRRQKLTRSQPPERTPERTPSPVAKAKRPDALGSAFDPFAFAVDSSLE